MRAVLLAVCVSVIFCASSGAWAAACPIGTFPAFDNFGNSICKSFEDGGTRSVQRKGPGCPAGMIPEMDNFGNQTCKSMDGQRFYDTSKGCPVGTIQSFDTFGKPVCKRI